MKKWIFQDNNFIFSFPEDGDNEDNCLILDSLTDNGIGIRDGNAYFIPAEGIYQLSNGQRTLLYLPPEYSNLLEIDCEGLINQSGFKYIPKFFVKRGIGLLRILNLNIPLLTICTPNGNEQEFLLPEDQYRVLLAINEANASAFINSSSSYRCLAHIKEIAQESSYIYFCSYLDSYDILSVDNLQLHIDYKDNKLEIAPDITEDVRKQNNIEEGAFSDRFDRRTRILPVYTLPGQNGKQHKIVIPAESEQSLSEIKQSYRTVEGEERIRQVIDTPQKFFDEEIFDLKEFYSDRVIEIGLYKPAFYSFVCPYKSEWIPGFVIEDRYNGNTNVFLNNEEAIHELEEAIHEAEQAGASEIRYKGYKLDLESAKSTLATAKEQNRHPEKKIKEDVNGKEVLIIEDNAESLGYKIDSPDVSSPDTYQFYPIEGLRESIHLKDHQTEGVAWLQHLTIEHNRGCLLADDMGLGKTLQVLCFIDWHKHHHNPDNKPYIIVAPVSLLDNWANEVSKFLKDGSLSTTIVHGNMVPKRLDSDSISWLKRQDIILTNYETVRSCQFNICAVDYAVAILDEAQKIKTPGTYVTSAAKALKADFKVAMTGTPVENTFMDLWCIMDYALPGLLGNAKQFAARYQHPLKSGETDVDSLGKELREKMGVFFLRRCKADVLKDLPEKTDYKKEIVMSDMQAKAYIDAVAGYQRANDKSQILNFISRLRAISESPYVDDDSADIEYLDINTLVASSGKIKETLDILYSIQNAGEKAIIFCEFKRSQRMLQRIIHEKFEICPRIINGDTKVLSSSRFTGIGSNYSRQQAIDAFEAKSGFNVIIMSPVAAGMGLNVTAANHVIHFGRHWNPAKESQATDRAYRIGQKKPVSVYYPITILPPNRKFKSFDQTLDELLMRKSQLADATLFPSESKAVTLEDFREFLSQSICE